MTTPEEAHRLLAARLGAERLAVEPDVLDELVALCARLPLALAIAAAHIETRPRLSLADFVRELRDSRHRLDTLRGDDTATDIRAVFACSYQALSPAAARLFRLLSVHPGPDVSAATAASLAGLGPAEAGPLLRELSQAHLVADHGAGRFIMHDLLREYAAERAEVNEADADRERAMCRVLDHYLHTAHRAALLLAPNRDPIPIGPAAPGTTPEQPADELAALAWFTAEHQVLLAAVQRARDAGFDSHAWRLAWTLADFLDRRGHWHDRVTAQLAALAAAQRLGDLRAEATVHRGLAIVYIRQGRTAESHEHSLHSLRLCAALGDRVGEANSHRGLAAVTAELGQLHDSLHHAQRALDIYREVGDRVGEARALNNVGWAHTKLGDHAGSIGYCRQALRLLQDLGDRLSQAATWDSLGHAHNRLGEYDEAVSCYRRSLDLCREMGDRLYEAESLTGLGDTYHRAGDAGAARAAWQQALDILEELSHPNAAAVRTRLAAA